MTRITEARNPNSVELDRMSTAEITALMNAEDATIAGVIKEILPEINVLIEQVVAAFRAGGRLFYIGAGTSGRLGVLDAVECVPTFGSDPEQVQGLIAGGSRAIEYAVEGAEDSLMLAADDLKEKELSERDVVIGLAASGRTPYVIGGLRYANEVGAVTGSIANNPDAAISKYADYPVEAVVGPEILTGSTRLKAGTAGKMILNMISTASFIQLGKAYENLMIDVQATNEKLVDRSVRMIAEATGVSLDDAAAYYREAPSVKVAILMILGRTDAKMAEKQLDLTRGNVREALEQLKEM